MPLTAFCFLLLSEGHEGAPQAPIDLCKQVGSYDEIARTTITIKKLGLLENKTLMQQAVMAAFYHILCHFMTPDAAKAQHFFIEMQDTLKKLRFQIEPATQRYQITHNEGSHEEVIFESDYLNDLAVIQPRLFNFVRKIADKRSDQIRNLLDDTTIAESVVILNDKNLVSHRHFSRFAALFLASANFSSLMDVIRAIKDKENIIALLCQIHPEAIDALLLNAKVRISEIVKNRDHFALFCIMAALRRSNAAADAINEIPDAHTKNYWKNGFIVRLTQAVLSEKVATYCFDNIRLHCGIPINGVTFPIGNNIREIRRYIPSIVDAIKRQEPLSPEDATVVIALLRYWLHGGCEEDTRSFQEDIKKCVQQLLTGITASYLSKELPQFDVYKLTIFLSELFCPFIVPAGSKNPGVVMQSATQNTQQVQLLLTALLEKSDKRALIEACLAVITQELKHGRLMLAREILHFLKSPLQGFTPDDAMEDTMHRIAERIYQILRLNTRDEEIVTAYEQWMGTDALELLARSEPRAALKFNK